MSKVCHLCLEQQRLGDPQADKVRAAGAFGRRPSLVAPSVNESMLNFQKRVRKLTPKVLQLLTEWTETFPYDFRDERMMRSLKELTHRLACGEEVGVFTGTPSSRCQPAHQRPRVSADGQTLATKHLLRLAEPREKLYCLLVWWLYFVSSALRNS